MTRGSERLTWGNDPAQRLRVCADRSKALHEAYLSDPVLLGQYQAFVAWQNQYMAGFYDDLRLQPGYSKALDFVITDLTGSGISQRDQDIARAVPAMTRMLPARALETLAAAMELNARVLQTNLRICETLFEHGSADLAISELKLCSAYRRAATLEQCLDLAALTRQLGVTLNGIIHVRALGLLLKGMRRPAHAAGFGALHDFLETGYARFTAIDDVPYFLDRIHARMTEILTRIFQEPVDHLCTQARPAPFA